MTPPSTTRTPHREPLSRQRALSAAIELADADGIDALTMRRLAQSLGVEAMSLYHHVANKSDILDGMVDMVFTEIELPADDSEWTTAMRRRAHSVRAALLAHPWAIGVMESRRAPGPATLRHHDAVIACCRRAGFSVEMSAHAFSLLDSYIYGFVLQEINLPFTDADDLAEVLDAMVPEDFADTYPHFAELTSVYVLRPDYSYGNEFDFGLGVILDGLDSAMTDMTRSSKWSGSMSRGIPDSRSYSPDSRRAPMS